jgi:outer membrane lipoprotein-sorting protein
VTAASPCLAQGDEHRAPWSSVPGYLAEEHPVPHLFEKLARIAVLALASLAAGSGAAEPTGREIVERVEQLLWGKTVQGDYEMTITTPRWQRSLGLQVWMDRPRRSFIRIVSPAKEAGIGSLRIGGEMWNYLPNVERIVKIPPSMMLQPWMGSDFTNDDLVKESSILDDYTHKVIGTTALDGQESLQVEATPKPEAPVVWGRVVYWVRKSDLMPLKQEYFSERGELVRVMSFSEVRSLGGRTLPTRWEMRPLAKPGNLTVVVLKNAVFNQPVDDTVFTQRNLQKP